MKNPDEYEWFVNAWLAGEHTEDVLEAVNAALRAAGRRPWTPSTLTSVANRLRKLGVRLPAKEFRQRLSERTPGVARLNALIDRVLKGATPDTPVVPPAPPRPAPVVDPREAVRKVLEEMKRERAGE